MQTASVPPASHVLVLLTSTWGGELDWGALRRDAGERNAVISLVVVDDDRAIAIVPATIATQAAKEIPLVRPTKSGSYAGWVQLIDDLFAVRAAVDSVIRTRIVMFADQRAHNSLRALLAGEPSIEIELRANEHRPAPLAQSHRSPVWSDAKSAPSSQLTLDSDLATRPDLARRLAAPGAERRGAGWPAALWHLVPALREWDSSEPVNEASKSDGNRVWHERRKWASFAIGAGLLAGLSVTLAFVQVLGPPWASVCGGLIASATVLALFMHLGVIDKGIMQSLEARRISRRTARGGGLGDVAATKTRDDGKYAMLFHRDGSLHEWRPEEEADRWRGECDMRSSPRTHKKYVRVRIGDFTTVFVFDEVGMRGLQIRGSSADGRSRIVGVSDGAKLESSLLELATS